MGLHTVGVPIRISKEDLNPQKYTDKEYLADK